MVFTIWCLKVPTCYGIILRDMSKKELPITSFLKDIMRQRGLTPNQLARSLGVNHSMVSRWLSGKDKPNVSSCVKLAEYSELPIYNVLSIVGYLPEIAENQTAYWPEFREYAQQKYGNELDEDTITMIEGLIEASRNKGPKRGNC